MANRRHQRVPCTEPGCDRLSDKLDLCQMHYARRWRTGTLPPRRSPQERFERFVDKNGPLSPHRPDLGACWLWTGVTNAGGYGQFQLRKGVLVYAHRQAYEWAVETIPSGLTIDHLCRTRSCVNPAHFEVVTSVENGLRGNTVGGLNKRKTHCLRGHPFDPKNTYISKTGQRTCRQCRREKARASVNP